MLAVDLRGMGETDRADGRNGSDFPRYFGDYDAAMTSFLVGKSLVGMRAADIVAAVDWLAARNDVDTDRIGIVGKGKAAVPSLYAAVFEQRIVRVALEDMLASYRTVAERRLHRDILENVVLGALRDFDLPDLTAALAPRPVRLINLTSPLGERLWPEVARDAHSHAARVYEAVGAGPSLKVLRRGTGAGPETVYSDFFS